jgi:ribosomal protein S18 acetylase RimI-like enzyme/mannose-6-phosphate isomerase-like protein (cupin superfamily)
MGVRRVVTGHDPDSKAVFTSDSLIEPQSVHGIPFAYLPLWSADRPPSLPDRGALQPAGDYYPPVGGVRFGIFTIPPERAVELTPEERRAARRQLEEVFPGLAAHWEVADPGMHTTDSIDFGYVVSGSIRLELDDGTAKDLHAGDTYVQNGTRHAWRNRGFEPCHILVVMVGTRREPSGLAIAAQLREAARAAKGAATVVPNAGHVMTRKVRVDRLCAADAARYRTLMLHAYAAAADAFTSTPEERATEPEAWWVRRIDDPKGLSFAFGAFVGDELVGTVTVEFAAKPKTRHKAHLIGMFVHESARGLGAGRALVEAALAAAAAGEGVRVVTLTVTEGNAPAIALYEACGFRAFGTEPMAIATPEGLKGKVHMWLELAAAR